MTNQPEPAPAVWIDGHPKLEAIAAAVWERCGRSDSGMCVEDDPRNIAVAALAAVAPATATLQYAFRVSEIRDNVLRRVHGYYASLQGAFAYCETEERKQPLIDTVRFELFPAPGGTQWMIHSFYGPDDHCPEISDLVITRIPVIPDETPADVVLPASTDRTAEVANLRTMYDAASARESELIDERDKLIRWHREDGEALAEMRGTIERLGAELRRRSAETGPAVVEHADNETQDQAHEAHHRWIVEIRDGGEWIPATGFVADRDHAAAQFLKASEQHPTFSDGTPVQRRFVRETTTYTVEPAPDQPAAGAQQPEARP